MNTLQNASPNYEAILQRIQQEIEGLKGFTAKLSLKDINVDLLLTQLKKTRTELEATQTKLEVMRRELEATQTALQTTQSDLKNTQTELRSRPSELRSTQIVSPKDGMEMVYVPAGKFLMGSRDDDPYAYNWEKPQHEVYLDPYWIDKTPVTNAMFSKFVQETRYVTEAEKNGYVWSWTGSRWELINGANWRNPRGPNSNLSGKDNYPVVFISWNDAVAYASWAGRRLPTEAEWEKAAGGIDGRKWPWGNEPPTNKLCNFNNNVGDTTSVDSYPDGASPYGALDMTGNSWEWCNDTFEENYYASSPKINPRGPTFQGSKVLRGSSWCDTVQITRIRLRGWDSTKGGGSGSFRCAQSLFLPSDNKSRKIENIMKAEQGVVEHEWSGETIESAEFDIRFESSFKTPPIVQASISQMDLYIPNKDPQGVRYRIIVDNITTEGAKIKIETWYNNTFWTVKITWLAIGE